MPLWCGILQASEAWGTPPWNWAGGEAIDWFYRWQFLTDENTKKQNRDLEKMNNG